MVLLSRSSITVCGIIFGAAQKVGVKLGAESCSWKFVPGFLSHFKDISEQTFLINYWLISRFCCLFGKGRWFYVFWKWHGAVPGFLKYFSKDESKFVWGFFPAFKSPCLKIRVCYPGRNLRIKPTVFEILRLQVLRKGRSLNFKLKKYLCLVPLCFCYQHPPRSKTSQGLLHREMLRKKHRSSFLRWFKAHQTTQSGS